MKVLDNLKVDSLRYCDLNAPCHLEAAFYPTNNRLALQIIGYFEEDGQRQEEPIATATVNLHDEPCPDNEIWVNNWAGNEGMDEQLIRWRVIEPESTATASSGFVTPLRYRLTPAFMLALGDALARQARGGT